MIKKIKNLIIGLIASSLFLVAFSAFFIALGSWVFLVSDEAKIVTAFVLGIGTMIAGSSILLLVNLLAWLGEKIVKQWLFMARN